jgi:deoxycytidylate deaminase
MKIDLDIIENLKILARTSTHPSVWVASCLVHRNKIVSYGINCMKSHPYQKKYGRNEDAIYFHAETSAIYTADKRMGFDKFQNSILYVCRIKYESTEKRSMISGLAKPCSGCMRCIQHYGIKSVIYTMDEINDYGIMVL